MGTGADTTEKVSKFYRAQMDRVSRLVALRRKVNDSYEGLRYVVPDHLGGTIRVVDSAGTTIDDIRYHAFGGTRSGGTAMPTDKLFTGQTMDASTGLYFYGARYYDAVLCRFLAPDRAGPDLTDPQSLNRYSYVLNNPVRYTDPTGNRPWDGEPEDEEGGGGGEGGGEAGGGEGGYLGDGGDSTGVILGGELGPLEFGLEERGQDSQVSTLLSGIAQTLDIVDASVTTAFAEVYGVAQLVSLALGPEAAAPVFAAFSVAYTPVQATMLVVDSVAVLATAGADIASGRTGLDVESRSFHLGLDTTVSVGTLLPGLVPTALGSIISVPFDAAQVSYDADRAAGNMPAASWFVEWR